MPNNIPNITVPAPVIQLNNIAFLTNGQFDPQTKNIPCGINALVDDIQHWAIPIKDFGICTNLFFEPAVGIYDPLNPNYGGPPTEEALLVLRVRDKFHHNWTWWVICTIAQYYASCQTCCGEDYVPIPEPPPPVIIPCQEACDSQDADGNYYVVFAAPALPDGQQYQTSGSVEGTGASSGLQADLDAVVAFLNSDFGTNVGSPPIDIFWTRNGNTIIGTIQDGEGYGSVICVVVQTVPI